MKKYIVKLNCTTFLEFELVNELQWTRCFLIQSNRKEYIGSENFQQILSGFEIMNSSDVRYPIIENGNDRITRILTLSDPYTILYKNLDEDNRKFYIQDDNLRFSYVLNIEVETISFIEKQETV